MTPKLSAYFPMLKTREQVLSKIRSSDVLQKLFDSWTPEQQTEFLDFTTGVRGAKMLYDFMFKEILNPETVPERMEDLLSCLLGQKLKILRVLPNDSTRIADEASLLITDIVVELADGSIANVEVQKIGYAFPGERSACYSADLLLRQYKRVRGQKKKKFSYKDIKDVFTIVLFEKSPAEFQLYPDVYLHYFRQKSNSGLNLKLLQKYLFIPLDIFRKIQQNKGIESKLEAWLAFLSLDEPDDILRILKAYPEFKPLYGHVYDMCQNMEKIMGLFSKELQELDRNTVQYMIDEMQEEINQQKEQLAQKEQQLSQKNHQLTEKDLQIQQQAQKIAELMQKLENQKLIL